MAAKQEKILHEGGEREYRLTFTERILGSQPMDKEIYERFIKSKATAIGVNVEDEELLIPEDFEKKMTGFYRDEDGIYLMDYQIKGQLKEAGNVLKDSLKITNCRSKVSQYVFVIPRRFRLKDKADGILQRPLKAMTMQGPRVSLSASEFVDKGISINIKIRLFPNPDISWEKIEKMLDYGAYHGIGQWANGGFGTYTWEVV